MIITIPRSVREAWGEEVTEDFIRWFDQAIRETTVSRDEFRQILSRLDTLEHDMAALKEEVRELRHEMRQQFNQINQQFNQVNQQFSEMNQRFDQMYDRILVMTRWTIGVIALFGAAITILLAVAQFTP